MRLRRLIYGGGALACLLLAVVKPAVIETDHRTGLLMLLRWQSGQIRFINSVTQEPVEIRFRIGCVFQHFSVSAAPMTESYYTSGTYPMNALAAAEKTAVLRLCSMRGISLKLGFYDMEINDECLEVRLLWTI